MKELAKRSVIVPTRGQQKDIGPGVSHKVETVRLFVAYLTEKGYTTKEIAFLVQVSERLTRDYQALYRKYKGDPAYKDRLDEILALNSVDSEPCKRGAIN
ncbi:DUF1670 domain-containing protein [Methanophagales archaeon]|nr:MAG: DUF1670 domain-containing protein [Methanophagales archaeon]